jgi:hypothetical protein
MMPQRRASKNIKGISTDLVPIIVQIWRFDLQLANLTAENLIAASGADLLIGAVLTAVLVTAVRRRAATMMSSMELRVGSDVAREFARHMV